VWLPEAGRPWPAAIQEIFGVSDYIRAVADDLAAWLRGRRAGPVLAGQARPHAATTRVAVKESFGSHPVRRRERALPMLTVALQHW